MNSDELGEEHCIGMYVDDCVPPIKRAFFEDNTGKPMAKSMAKENDEPLNKSFVQVSGLSPRPSARKDANDKPPLSTVGAPAMANNPVKLSVEDSRTHSRPNFKNDTETWGNHGDLSSDHAARKMTQDVTTEGESTQPTALFTAFDVDIFWTKSHSSRNGTNKSCLDVK